MDLKNLFTYLTGKGTALNLDADDANLQQEFQAFISTMPGKKINISRDVSGLTLENSLLTITGTSSDNWPVQGLCGVSMTLASITITIDGSNNPAVFTGIAQAILAPFSQGINETVLVTALNQEANPWRITLAQNAANITPMQVILLGKIGELPFEIPAGMDFLNAGLTVDKGDYSVTFYPNSGYDCYTEFTLNTPAAVWKPVPDIFSFNGLDIKGVLKTNGVSVLLVAHLNIDKIGVDVSISMSGSQDWLVLIAPTPPGQVFPGLAALANWIGGNSLAGSIDSGFSGTKLKLDGFDAAISAVIASVHISNCSLNYLEIQSLLVLGALQLDIALRLPDLTITGSLHDQKAVNVSDLLKSLALTVEDVPTALTISEAAFSADLTYSVYSAALTVDGIWQAGPLTLEEVDLTLSYNAYNGLAGSFGCQFCLGTAARVLLMAEYEGANSGWMFSGGLEPGTKVEINDVLAFLENHFSINEVPEPLRSLELTGLSVSYSTGTGNFKFTCDGNFQVYDTPVALSIDIDIDIKKEQQGYSSFFGGKLTVNNLDFNVEFDANTEHDVFIATYNNTSSGSIVLKDLIQSISDKLASDIPSSLEIDLTEAKFIFFKQDSVKEFALGFNLGTSISLSDLPLIGGKLPPDLSAGVDKLQFMFSSAQFSKENVAIINPLLPQDIDSLPEEGVAAGVQLSGEFNCGGQTKPFKLGNSDAANKQNAASADSGAPAETTTIATTAEPVSDFSPTEITWLTIQKQFGPVQFQRIGVEFHDNMLLFALDASIMEGPLTISMDGLTFGSSLTKFQPNFELQGLGISYIAPSLSITGGALKIPEAELAPDVSFQFDGAVAVSAAKWGLTGLASYAVMKDGAPSLFVFASYDGTIGGPPYFVVEGLMGGFGFNRKLQMPGLDEVMDFPLLAIDAAQGGDDQSDGLKVLEILEGKQPGHNSTSKKWLEPLEGDYWLAAGIRFASFELVHGEALLVAQFGHDLQFALLGLAWMRLPQKASDADSYVYIELQLAAVLKPTEGYLGISAVLTPNSYLITKDCHLTGGFAFCIWFGANKNAGQFVLTVGGYHPAFKPPDYYPVVPRVGFNWTVSSDVSIKGGAYMALTPSCCMAGGSLEVLFSMGDLRAWFTAHTDMLVAWHPFSFVASASVEIGVSYRLNLLFCHKTISVSIGASLDLWGPPTGGTVTVDVVIVSFTVSFGADSSQNKNDQPLDWNGFKELLPAKEDVCKIIAGKGLFKTLDKTTTDGTSTKVWVVRSGEFSFFTQSAIRVRTLIPSDNTNAPQNPADDSDTISIRPMNKTGVLSLHNITIYQNSPASSPIDLTGWTLASNRTSMPASLWGAPLTSGGRFVQNPPVPSNDVIDDGICGYHVCAPLPILGATLGLVPIEQLREEYLTPATGPAENPLSTNVKATMDYLPDCDEDSNKASIGDIGEMAGTAATTQRNLLYSVLKEANIYQGNNDDMTMMAANAEHLFSDAPMEQA